MSRLGGGRTWWAHLEFTRINIKPTIRKKELEDLRTLGAFSDFVTGSSLRNAAS
jgi:hypothetical protein